MKTGANIRPCNVRDVEKHNRRDKDYIEGVVKSGRNLYFFQDLTHLNSSKVWQWGHRDAHGNFIANEYDYQKQTVAQLFEHEKELYTKLVGRKPMLKDRVITDKKTGRQRTISGWSPIREAVIPIKPDTKIEDFNMVVKWFLKKKVHPVRLDIHHDEGYKAEDGTMKMNHHAHLVLDYLDHSTGKTNKLSLADMSELQTILAESLGMERGTPKKVTGKKHKTVGEYREEAAVRHAMEAEKKAQEAENYVSDAQNKVNDLLTQQRQIKAVNSQLNEQNGKLKKDNEELERQKQAKNQEIENLKKKIEELKKTSIKNKDYLADLNKIIDVYYDFTWEPATDAIIEDSDNTGIKHPTAITAMLIDKALTPLDSEFRLGNAKALIKHASDKSSHPYWVENFRNDIEYIAENGAERYCQEMNLSTGISY